MAPQNELSTFDSAVIVSDRALLQRVGDAALIGSHFLFLTPEWYRRTGLLDLIAPRVDASLQEPIIMFRGKRWIHLAGLQISPMAMPDLSLVSLSCDKQLYRSHHDTVHLLIVAPHFPKTRQVLKLFLNESHYADYTVELDSYGLALWRLQNLPEGQYKARIDGTKLDFCRFEVAEYRLAPLNVELLSQELVGNNLNVELAVTKFQQPHTGNVAVELQENGQRVGQRQVLSCDWQGRCVGSVEVSGPGPYSLNVFVNERTATVALKGSEKARREALVISELGQLQTVSLLPLPGAVECRGMYIAPAGQNNEPFLVQRVIGNEVVVTPRTPVDALSVVVVDPQHDRVTETTYSHLNANEPLQVQVTGPYSLIFLGAVINERCWEGWCGVINPSKIRLECQVPAQATPGAQITVRLKTDQPDRPIPVQLIVKDQRVVAPTDPQVELAAQIKNNLALWSDRSYTGYVERKVAEVRRQIHPRFYRASAMGPVSMGSVADERERGIGQANAWIADEPVAAMPMMASITSGAVPAPAESFQLPRVRMQFPEVVFNQIVLVQGEEQVGVKLGESLGTCTVEAFALDRESLDWQRVETSFQVTRSVWGELTVAPFMLPGDAVLGQLEIGSLAGEAIAEVQLDGQPVPLFLESGQQIEPARPLASGTVLRFPLRPGVVTSIVRVPNEPGTVDVSERVVSEMGSMHHIAQRLRLLQVGQEVALTEPGVVEILPLPGLEQPFDTFVQAASQYPYGCVEQTCSMLLAMFTGYLFTQEQPEKAGEYATAVIAWHKRLQSMELPRGGFCMYPPADGGRAKVDTHYAPLAMKHLLKLPTVEDAGLNNAQLEAVLQDLHSMRRRGMAYYELEAVPRQIRDCEDAYLILRQSDVSGEEKARAASFVRQVLREEAGKVFVDLEKLQSRMKPDWYGQAVLSRYQTAYAVAALLLTQEGGDLAKAVAGTNYLLGQLNEQGRFYSTVDTAAGLVLFLGLRRAGIATNGESGRLELNGREMSMQEALKWVGRVEKIRCVSGLVSVRVTTEVVEDWRTFRSDMPVEVRLEKQGRAGQIFEVGDELELLIKVPRYEPGLLAHICLPDALARVVGGGQVKRFSLDFCEQSVLRVPLAVVGSTGLAGQQGEQVQHWAVIVRNMFKEEQIGNPGLLQLQVLAR